MDKVKSLLKYQKQIIEGFFVSLIGAWAIVSVVKGATKKIDDIQFAAQSNFVANIILIILFGALLGLVYYKKDFVARLIMFVAVYCFVLLSAMTGYEQQWGEINKNPIGNVCFQGVLCFVAVLTFLYVKEDVLQLFKSLVIDKVKARIIFILIGVFLFAFIGIVTVYRYITYSNSTFDFGIFAQMYEHMKQTGLMNTTVERNTLLSHFGVHFSPIFYIALPIYFIFPSPVTVQLIQAVMVALPVIPIVLLCRHYKMSHWMSVAMVLLYALYPATAGGTFYDIHENCFLTFFVLLAIYAVEKKKDILTIFMVLLVFLVKEDAAVYIMVFGAYLLFSRRDKKRGILLIIASAIYFGVAITIVNSYGLGILDNRFGNLYFDPNAGLGQIIQTIISNPGYVLAQVVSNSDAEQMDKIGYLIVMIVPVAVGLFATGKKYSRFILMSPFIVFNVFTTYLYLHDISFQYNFGVIALFMYLMIMNLSELKVEKAKTFAITSVICASIMFAGAIFPKMDYYVTKYSENKANFEKMNKAIDLVPADASVSASGFLVPHLADHLDMYDQNHLTEMKMVEYLVIDERGSEREKFNDLLNTGQYDLIYNEPNLISVYHKK